MAEDYPPGEVTPPLTEFRERYEADDNWWWRISCGHHQNLFDAACEEIDRLRAEAEQQHEAVTVEIDRLTDRLAESGERYDAEHEQVLNLTDEVNRLRAQLQRPQGRIEAQHDQFVAQHFPFTTASAHPPVAELWHREGDPIQDLQKAVEHINRQP